MKEQENTSFHKIIEAAKISGLLVYGIFISPIQIVAESPLNLIREMRQSGYKWRARSVAVAAAALPLAAVAASIYEGEPLEMVVFRGVATYGVEGFISFPYRTSLLREKNKKLLEEIISKRSSIKAQRNIINN